MRKGLFTKRRIGQSYGQRGKGEKTKTRGVKLGKMALEQLSKIGDRGRGISGEIRLSMAHYKCQIAARKSRNLLGKRDPKIGTSTQECTTTKMIASEQRQGKREMTKKGRGARVRLLRCFDTFALTAQGGGDPAKKKKKGKWVMGRSI